MRIVCVSDTHLKPFAVPAGDVLVHAGDATMMGTEEEVAAWDAWLATLPHPHKVVIAGNHDFLFESQPERARALLRSAIYLQDSLAEVPRPGGQPLRIWGSPWQPWFHDWAFNLQRGEALAERWRLIPEGLDVLLTHGPPAGILDVTDDGRGVGCEDLRQAVAERKPALHVFGHIHEGYGERLIGATRYVNASICDRRYRPVNAPFVFDLD